MVEKQEHPVPPEPGSEHPRPRHPLPHELGHHRPPEPHGPRGPRPPEPGEAKREVELRPIAEDLITALESEDRELRIKAVVGILSRFELKKVEDLDLDVLAEARDRVGLLAGLFRPKKVRVEPRPGHPRPPVPGEHPEHPRPPHLKPRP